MTSTEICPDCFGYGCIDVSPSGQPGAHSTDHACPVHAKKPNGKPQCYVCSTCQGIGNVGGRAPGNTAPPSAIGNRRRANRAARFRCRINECVERPTFSSRVNGRTVYVCDAHRPPPDEVIWKPVPPLCVRCKSPVGNGYITTCPDGSLHVTLPPAPTIILDCEVIREEEEA